MAAYAVTQELRKYYRFDNGIQREAICKRSTFLAYLAHDPTIIIFTAVCLSLSSK